MVYYLIGLPYLYITLVYYLHQPASLLRVIEIGLLPFIGFDLLKAVLAAWLAREISRRLQP
jgi:biotin transport system substrate-specific component